MRTRKDVSILIPTHGRPRKLCACLAALARQTADPAQVEILVGFDGADEPVAAAARRTWAAAGGRAALHIVQCARAGYNSARNRLLELATGRMLLSLNDDVIPTPGLVEAHRSAQREAAVKLDLPGAVISGRSPWVTPEDDTLFDRLVRETPMIFFAGVMHAAAAEGAEEARWRDWGFRHAWGLNMSAPLDLVREAGGWTAFPLAYGYDDIELAWRLQQRGGLPVLYRPQAEASHDHRYGPEDVLERERRLGESAWLFARANPAFCGDVFGRDITSAEEVGYARAFVQREARDAERLRARFCSLANVPAGAVGGAHAADLLDSIYQQHVLLKRWEWRRGLLRAAEGTATEAPAPAAAPAVAASQ